MTKFWRALHAIMITVRVIYAARKIAKLEIRALDHERNRDDMLEQGTSMHLDVAETMNEYAADDKEEAARRRTCMEEDLAELRDNHTTLAGLAERFNARRERARQQPGGSA